MTDKEKEVSPEKLMAAARHEVDRLTRRSRRDLIVQAVLAAATIALILLAGDQVYQNHASCEAGNSYRAGNQQIWNDFIALAVASNKNSKQVQQFAISFERQVAMVDQPKACPLVKLP